MEGVRVTDKLGLYVCAILSGLTPTEDFKVTNDPPSIYSCIQHTVFTECQPMLNETENTFVLMELTF